MLAAEALYGKDGCACLEDEYANRGDLGCALVFDESSKDGKLRMRCHFWKRILGPLLLQHHMRDLDTYNSLTSFYSEWRCRHPYLR